MIRTLFIALGCNFLWMSLGFCQEAQVPPLAGNLAPVPSASTDGNVASGHPLLNLDGLFQGPGYWDLQASYLLVGVVGKKSESVPIAYHNLPGSPVTRFPDSLSLEHLEHHLVSGGQFGLGYWWTEKNPWLPGEEIAVLGAESRFFFVGSRSLSFIDGESNTLVRPFFDTSTGTQTGVIIAAPGFATGRISGSATENIWGAEANLWKNLYYDVPGTVCTLEGMAGIRYLHQDTGAKLSRFSQYNSDITGPYSFLAGNTISSSESFTANNNFVGGQIGLRGKVYMDPHFYVSSELTLALGGNFESLSINGTQTRVSPTTGTTVTPGGLLAMPSNIGTLNQTRFAQVPTGNLLLCFPYGNCLEIKLGGTALCWSRIARIGGSEISNPQIDATTIPGWPGSGISTSPVAANAYFKQSDIWIVGLVLSAELKW